MSFQVVPCAIAAVIVVLALMCCPLGCSPADGDEKGAGDTEGPPGQIEALVAPHEKAVSLKVEDVAFSEVLDAYARQVAPDDGAYGWPEMQPPFIGLFVSSYFDKPLARAKVSVEFEKVSAWEAIARMTQAANCGIDAWGGYKFKASRSVPVPLMHDTKGPVLLVLSRDKSQEEGGKEAPLLLTAYWHHWEVHPEEQPMIAAAMAITTGGDRIKLNASLEYEDPNEMQWSIRSVKGLALKDLAEIRVKLDVVACSDFYRAVVPLSGTGVAEGHGMSLRVDADMHRSGQENPNLAWCRKVEFRWGPPLPADQKRRAGRVLRKKLKDQPLTEAERKWLAEVAPKDMIRVDSFIMGADGETTTYAYDVTQGSLNSTEGWLLASKPRLRSGVLHFVVGVREKRSLDFVLSDIAGRGR